MQRPPRGGNLIIQGAGGGACWWIVDRGVELEVATRRNLGELFTMFAFRLSSLSIQP